MARGGCVCVSLFLSSCREEYDLLKEMGAFRKVAHMDVVFSRVFSLDAWSLNGIDQFDGQPHPMLV